MRVTRTVSGVPAIGLAMIIVLGLASPPAGASGDDVLVGVLANPQDHTMAIAANGDIFAAADYLNDNDISQIQVYRSRDGGTTWQEWGFFGGDYELFDDAHLHIAEGAADRCFLAYKHYFEGDGSGIEVAYLDLDSETPDWTRVVAISYNGMSHFQPSLETDDQNYGDYNVYLACSGNVYPPSEPPDIWFARSTDQGATWETPYVIADNNYEDMQFLIPSISYGLGGYVHVAWMFRDTDHTVDQCIMYRRAAGRAASGIGAWGTMLSLTPSTDGMWDDHPQVVASPVSPDVMVTYNRGIRHGFGDWEIYAPGVMVSHNYGVTFPDAGLLTGGLARAYSLAYQTSTDSWIVGGGVEDAAAIQRASASAPLSWTAPEVFSDVAGADHNIWWGRIALDPSHSERVAVTWLDWEYHPQPLMFDAEWRGDPGYPNLEENFPLALDHMPISPPAVVDLDDDGDLEIVYSSNDQRIQAFHHDGSPLAGWPVDVGHSLADGPVAVGALRTDGTLYVVAGTMDGLAVAYHADGQPAAGWPVDTRTGEPTYVSIGSLGGFVPRSVVIAAGERVTFADWTGEMPTGANRHMSFGRNHIAPCAIGDVDGDGIAEVVCGPSDRVVAFQMCSSTGVLSKTLPANVSDAITLADLDRDGDMEILVPTANGTLHALYANGLDFPGAWPFSSSTGTPLTSAAIAQCAGTSAPELAVGAREWTVHLLGDDGTQQPGYPVATGESWNLYAAPVVGRVFGDAADVIAADRTSRAWSWTELGEVNPGWPRDTGAAATDSPALGDLDQDGSTELVVLTADQLLIYDLNQAGAPPHEVWPMYGHDPQRTGCADCPEDVVSAVAEDDGTVTRVSFAPPTPNPMSGPVTFRFAVPMRAAVALEIYDVRGHCVRTVLKEEREGGVHFIGWDGRDRAGRRMASGHYVARLQVRGEGVRQVLTRKVTLLH